MTQVELNFFESVPKQLGKIVIELKRLNTNLEKLTASNGPAPSRESPPPPAENPKPFNAPQNWEDEDESPF